MLQRNLRLGPMSFRKKSEKEKQYFNILGIKIPKINLEGITFER